MCDRGAGCGDERARKGRGVKKRSDTLAKMQTPQARRMYDRSLKKWNKKLKPLTDSIRESQRMTADDFKIIVR